MCSAGELVSSWAIVKTDDPGPPVLLPTWFRLPIERALAFWQRENDKWTEKLRARQIRGARALTPAKQKAYDEWKADHVRRIILDKKRQCQLPRSELADLRDGNARRRKDFLLIELYMAEEAENLGIRSGSGPWYRLQLLRGARPTVAVPEAMDVAPGAGFADAVSAAEDAARVDAPEDPDPDGAPLEGWGLCGRVSPRQFVPD